VKAVHLRGVSFTYRGSVVPALRCLECVQEVGEFVVLGGRSGAGKSTLCKVIMGIVPALQRGEMEGDVRILERRIEGLRPFQVSRWAGLVFQDFEAQLFSTSVELEVAFGPENLGLPREEVYRWTFRECSKYHMNELVRMIEMKPEGVELVLTGRGADPRIIEAADLVTEMREVKHYYQQGVMAREGIER